MTEPKTRLELYLLEGLVMTSIFSISDEVTEVCNSE